MPTGILPIIDRPPWGTYCRNSPLPDIAPALSPKSSSSAATPVGQGTNKNRPAAKTASPVIPKTLKNSSNFPVATIQTGFHVGPAKSSLSGWRRKGNDKY